MNARIPATTITCHHAPWSLSRPSTAGNEIHCFATSTATTTATALMRILTTRSITSHPSAGPGPEGAARRRDDGRASAAGHALRDSRLDRAFERRLHGGPFLDGDRVVVRVPKAVAGHDHVVP